MMQRDIILKVWLFLSRPVRAKEKQRLSSSFLLDDDTLRGTKRCFAVAKPTHAKHGVERRDSKKEIMGNEMMRK